MFWYNYIVCIKFNDDNFYNLKKFFFIEVRKGCKGDNYNSNNN